MKLTNVRFQAKVTCAGANQTDGCPGQGGTGGREELERKDQEELGGGGI